ncbi:MAG: hypothetical protein H6740_08265 [Alphaproteobacteria bacterium]|nr:hypothetical protein [Alphaproteobacteria bacterium]
MNLPLAAAQHAAPTFAPPTRVLLRQHFCRMDALSEAQRRTLAEIRASRNHPLPPEAAEAEEARFLRSLDFYTHVTLGLDPAGRIRSFSALRWEPRLEGPEPVAQIIGGPHFRARGTRLRGQERGLISLVLPAMLRRPDLTLVFGSAVSILGYAAVLRAVRGTVPVHLWGDEDTPPLSRALLERLQQGPKQGRVRWDAERQVLCYAAGPELRQGDLSALSALEQARYLERVPEALGRENGYSPLVAFQGSGWDVLRFLARFAWERLLGARERAR